LVAGIEALESAQLDAALVARMQERASRAPLALHVPTFKSYATSELSGGGRHAWPAVSITGGACKLQCDHCRAKILEPMIRATTPEALWRVANDAVGRGARGMLLSGGSNHRDEVEYAPFLPTVRRIKEAFPEFRIAMHTALVDDATARAIEGAGVDVAMLDVIGAQDTVAQVYHLRRPVADFEASLERLVATSMKVVPHIVIGLHYGRLLGEWRALEMIARHRPAALVLVVVMPQYASAQRPFATPSPHEVGGFFLEARACLRDVPVLLGCARPAGRARMEIDAYATMAGLQGIAHPADGIVALARALGRELTVRATCCSIGIDEEAPRVDPDLLVARTPRASSFPVPVVAA
jgi:hypothetical protein